MKECMHSYSAREKGDHVCCLNKLKQCSDMMQLKNVMFFCHIDTPMKQGQDVWDHGMEHIGFSVLLLLW